MTKQTRKFITTLRQQFKAADDTTKQQIWHILTALRGPDNYTNSDEKSSTTAVIRNVVFGNSLSADVPAEVNQDNELYKEYRKTGNFKSYHFNYHAKEAFDTLNLKWNEVNTPKTKKKIKK